MTSKILKTILPFLIISAIILASCNLPGVGGLDSEAQVQTYSAATIQAQVNQYMTQTASVPQVIVITATPQPTATTAILPTATSVPPTAVVPTAVPPTITPVPIPCNQAAFITDVTVPDGTSFVVGVSFVKTWRIRNTGSCTWGSGYAVVFLNGNSMSAPATVTLPRSVQPGEIVDVSVPMVAPSDTGNYSGNWLLRAPNGAVFGVGYGGGVPLTTVIKVSAVPTAKDPNTIYDFVKNYCAAQWRTNAAFITCPSTAINYTAGSITRTYAPLLENGITDDEGAIITVPATGGDGFIQGQFPGVVIHSGDHFVATTLCSYQKPQCSVTFEVLAQEVGSATITSLNAWSKVYDSSIVPVNIDLSSFDGKNMIFYLKVSSNGNSTDDMAQWMAARITHP